MTPRERLALVYVVGNRSQCRDNMRVYSKYANWIPRTVIACSRLILLFLALKPLVSRYAPRMLRDGTAELPGTGAKMELDFVRPHKASLERLPTRPEKSRHAPSSAAGDHDCERGGITMFDFITSPDAEEPPKPPTRAREVRAGAIGRPTSYGGFMDLGPPRSMVKMTNRESYPPLAQISLLFFLWGFAYGLLDVLNSQFQIVVRMSFGQTMGLHSAYFG
jgi:hypothetical protein